MDLPARKDTLRRLVLARRSRLDDAERDARAARIVERLGDLPEIARARTVLAFVPYRSEPPVRAFLAGVIDRGARLLLPFVGDDGTLHATAVGSLDELSPGFRGIPEPRTRTPVDPATTDVVVVPGVAFDASGNRLGYGGGFYDAFLLRCGGALRVGICFEVQIVDVVPTAAHDEPVDVVVTEERVLSSARRSLPID